MQPDTAGGHRAHPHAGRVVVRLARPEEYARAGDLTADVYVGDGHTPADSEYVEELRDAAARGREAELLVAELDGEVAGTVTFAPAGSPWAEVAREGEAEFRMLAVAPSARRRGVGEALVSACIDRARATGCSSLVMSTQASMGDAHRIYGRLGFTRAPERDWSPAPGVPLVVYVLQLR